MWYNKSMEMFAKLLLEWYDRVRRDLPWRSGTDPYRVWVSEIMLQQTRVETAEAYYTRFLERFPSVEELAAAREEEVLSLWAGLGYYGRARNLHRSARILADAGAFPDCAAAWKRLPGVGEYTAGAIASIALGERVPAVDGNVERVVSRVRGIREEISAPAVRKRIRDEAARQVPAERPGDFNQAVMDLGATVCIPAAPRCGACPLRTLCDAFAQGDADRLPVKNRAPAQRTVPRGIAVLLRGGRTFVTPRRERLLEGMWCFPGFDGVTDTEGVLGGLRALGIEAEPLGRHASARHVFSHVIWEMEIRLFRHAAGEGPAEGRWVTAEELEALPRPAAMRAAEELFRENA